MSDISPGTVAYQFWRWFWVGIGALVLLAILILAGWRAGWWFSNQNATRQYQQIQNGVSNQETLRAQITDKLATVQSITVQIADPANKSMVSALKAQRMGVATIVCADAAQITGVVLPKAQGAWVGKNCLNGSVSPKSSLYQSGAPGQ